MNSAANSAGYCGYCGAHSTQPHPRCEAAAELEPPRYCRQCGRRMVVQVDPLSWRARCSQHGEQRG